MRSRSLTIWLMGLVLCMAASQVKGVVEFKDGWTYNIDYDISDEVWVDYQAPGMRTTVNLLDGADIGTVNNYFRSYEDSIVNMYEGATDPPTIYDCLYGYDRSQITVSGGEIARNLIGFDSSVIEFSGGRIGYNIAAYDNSQVTISGGTVVGLLGLVGNAQVELLNGTIGDILSTRNNSEITISGGSIGSQLETYDNSLVTISGGHIGGDIRAGAATADPHTVIITIEGTDFHINGLPMGYGTYTRSDYVSGNITCTLANGGSLNNTFHIYDDASLVLTPEPSTLLLLGLGAVMVRRKRN